MRNKKTYIYDRNILQIKSGDRDYGNYTVDSTEK